MVCVAANCGPGFRRENEKWQQSTVKRRQDTAHQESRSGRDVSAKLAIGHYRPLRHSVYLPPPSPLSLPPLSLCLLLSPPPLSVFFICIRTLSVNDDSTNSSLLCWNISHSPSSSRMPRRCFRSARMFRVLPIFICVVQKFSVQNIEFQSSTTSALHTHAYILCRPDFVSHKSPWNVKQGSELDFTPICRRKKSSCFLDCFQIANNESRRERKNAKLFSSSQMRIIKMVVCFWDNCIRQMPRVQRAWPILFGSIKKKKFSDHLVVVVPGMCNCARCPCQYLLRAVIYYYICEAKYANIESNGSHSWPCFTHTSSRTIYISVFINVCECVSVRVCRMRCSHTSYHSRWAHIYIVSICSNCLPLQRLHY